jgi:hypothetical protein
VSGLGALWWVVERALAWLDCFRRRYATNVARMRMKHFTLGYALVFWELSKRPDESKLVALRGH